MKKSLLLFAIIFTLMMSIALAQIEPNVTNISSSVTYGSFSFGGSLDGVACIDIGNNDLWCFGNNVKHIYIFDTDTFTITNPYNLSSFDNGGALGDMCAFYNEDLYCFGNNNSNYRINVTTGNETKLADNNIEDGFTDCDLRPNTDEIYCWGDDNSAPTTQSWFRVYNVSSDSWTYPLNRNYGTIDTKAIDYNSCDFVSNDVFVCYGGYNSTGNTEPRLMEYNVATNTTTIIDTGQPFTAGTCHEILNILYCTYGTDDDAGTPLDGIYYYDYTIDTFGTLNATLPVGFTLYGEAGLIGNKMYNLGGYATDNYDESSDIFEVNFICNPSWSPYYTTCTIGDNQTLLYNDTNGCQVSDGLPVDNGTVSSCNYCTLQFSFNTTECLLTFEEITYPVYDNFASCCNVTSIPADCNLPANTSVTCVGIHESGDVPSVVIDSLVELGRNFVEFAPLIVIVTLVILGLGYLGIKKLELF